MMEPRENRGRCRHRKYGALSRCEQLVCLQSLNEIVGKAETKALMYKSGYLHKAKNTTTVYMVGILKNESLVFL